MQESAETLDVGGVRVSQSYSRGEAWLLKQILLNVHNQERLRVLAADPFYQRLLSKTAAMLRRCDEAPVPGRTVHDLVRNAKVTPALQEELYSVYRCLRRAKLWKTRHKVMVAAHYGISGNALERALLGTPGRYMAEFDDKARRNRVGVDEAEALLRRLATPRYLSCKEAAE